MKLRLILAQPLSGKSVAQDCCNSISNRARGGRHSRTMVLATDPTHAEKPARGFESLDTRHAGALFAQTRFDSLEQLLMEDLEQVLRESHRPSSTSALSHSQDWKNADCELAKKNDNPWNGVAAFIATPPKRSSAADRQLSTQDAQQRTAEPM